MEGILIFLIFLGPLVFFHELGHFIFARLAGVRVEVFSIGFGPKILSFKKGDTQYAFSIIPLGGYVKMFGDDPLSEKELTPEEEKVAYTKKGKLARFWIVFGGPLANFILAFFIYAALVGVGEKVPEVKLGKVKENTIFYSQGFRTGDVISKVNNLEITSFDDFNMLDANIKTVHLKRNNKFEVINVNYKVMNFLETYGKNSEPLRAPVMTNGGEDQFLVFTPNDKLLSLEEYYESKFDELKIYSFSGDFQLKFSPENYQASDLKLVEILKLGESTSWKERLRSSGYYSNDLKIKNIIMGSAAEKAQLKKNDLIIGVAGNQIFNFDQLRSEIKKLDGEQPLEITVFKDGKIQEMKITPTYNDYNGQKRLSIGIESGISFYARMVESSTSGFFAIISKAWSRTIDGMINTVAGFKKLIVGEVSLKHVGGPIAIGQVATESFNIGLSMFFRLMAIISINLGVINLFPIPVLDGGHIVFIILEAINRGPLSRKKMMYAQQFGMSVLFLLIFVALFNDISRFFF